MELRHLRSFVAIAEAQSFSRAAEALRITQPALSRQVRDLEEELSCTLLSRGGNARVELTPAGARLLRGARALLTNAEDLVKRVQDGGRALKLGHYGSLWIDFFDGGLKRFQKANPRVKVQPLEFAPGTLPEALRSGKLDVALVGLLTAGIKREFSTRHIASVPAQIVLSANHPLAKRRKLQLQELRTAEWIVWNDAEFPGRRKLLVDACKRLGFTARISATTDSNASLFLQIGASAAVGYTLPMASQLPHRGVVFAKLEEPHPLLFDMYLAWPRRGFQSRLAESLANALAAVRDVA